MNEFFFLVKCVKKDEKTFSILYLDLQKSFPPFPQNMDPFKEPIFKVLVRVNVITYFELKLFIIFSFKKQKSDYFGFISPKLSPSLKKLVIGTGSNFPT